MADLLEVELIHFYPLENSAKHNTDRFELVHSEPAVPILRRGQAFTIAVRFVNRSFDENIDVVRLVFDFGPRPNALKGTKGLINVTKKSSEHAKTWSMTLNSNADNTLMMEVQSPVDTPVGVWQMHVETSLKNSDVSAQTFEYDQDIFLLFNPWHKDDAVYMPDTRLLDEYILTDVGKIWVGPWGSSRGREWIFGQFDACALQSAMLIFERSGLPFSVRGDPIRMSRCISKMVNSNDDQGILVGRWDGDYKDGTAPAAWTGSVEILEKFVETGESVNYGQCWVFAGVLTTICRALGIPSRVVSNLVSAHDANASLSVDKYFNSDGDELEFDPLNTEGEDSIWNYHVWNDVWMARLDLPKGYGGWQAVDATPQEVSSGFYQCGPASLEAIKHGAVGYNYDVPFMLASVNADLMRWKEDPTHELGYSRIYCNKYHIGRMILTKQPWIFDPNGDQDREDITAQYKAKEGTQAERFSLMRAVRSIDNAKSFYSVPAASMEDVEFDLVELERVNIGENFSVTVHIKNNSDKPRKIKAIICASSVFYTGIKANSVKKASGEFVVKPNKSEQLHMTVTADEYLDKLVEYCIMKISSIATVIDTNQTWADEDDFQVIKPTIDLKIEDELIVDKPVKIKMSFTNPLKKKLTNCQFHLASPGLIKHQIIPYRDIGMKEAVTCFEQFVPISAGEKKIVATFSSIELVDVTGSLKVTSFEE